MQHHAQFVREGTCMNVSGCNQGECSHPHTCMCTAWV